MIRQVSLVALMIGLVAGIDTGPAWAQDQTASSQAGTDQSDRDEEDWRRSQRKRTRDGDIESILNPSATGVGGNLPPLRTIDTLPEESRRHLQRQRAKVIGEVEFGEEIPEYEPSDAAKSDPQLAADEQEAWEVILTDLQGSGGGGDETGEGGPNNVAVAGVGGSAPTSVTRGGSTQSASDILAQLKGLKEAGVTPGGSGPASSTPDGSEGGGAAQSATGNGAASVQTEASQSSEADSDSDENSGAANQGGDPAAGASPAGEASDGSSDAEAASSDSGAGDSSDGISDGGGADGNDGGDEGESGAASEDRTRPPAEPISPLERVRVAGPTGESGGARSSATDFLKDQKSSDSD
ncbi:MAG: hypothetical protein AAF950_09670 [Pseudomonadota bacterium]